MEFSLIANSGIQLFTRKIRINKAEASSIRYFHEWFDEEEVQTNLEFAYLMKESNKFVKWADLENCGFVTPEGKLKVKEEEVFANPNIKVIYEGDAEYSDEIFSMRLFDNGKLSKVEEMFNNWLPIPYYELDILGGYKPGPYNWVRCKIIPRKEECTDNIIAGDMLIAFDTRSTYDDSDDYNECPNFISNTEKDKKFRLCSRASAMMDFCSGRNSWVRSYLMNIVHGVTEIEDIALKRTENENDEKYKYTFLASFLMLIDYLDKEGEMPEVRLVRDRGVSEINVEMIVDIGNSRTAAILFEDEDFKKVEPLRLQNFSFPISEDGKLNRTQESFDMRVAFQKVSFGEKTLDGSPQFVWPSLIRLGAEAEYLAHEMLNLAEGDEILSTYSSPKRYLWDLKPRREEWRCVKTSENGGNEEPIIEGISNYLNDDGSVDKDGFGFGLHYSRKSLMTFAFLEIICQANAQINSYEYREEHGRTSTPRRIDKIILTCPTAMSKNEQLSLHNSLEDALFILNEYNHNVDASGIPMQVRIIPELKKRTSDDESPWIFDEATCSQFVYLYGQFCERFLNCSEELFNLYGKVVKDKDGNDKKSLVVGSLDIGAGTSDIMICNYDYNEKNPSLLKPIPIFWDSFESAGDDMMKVLIENVLIGGKDGQIEHELRKRERSENDIVKMLFNYFCDHNKLSFQDKIKHRDFNLQVLVPVIYKYLELLGDNIQYRELSFDDIFVRSKPSQVICDNFKENFDIDLRDIRWTYDAEILSHHIEAAMNDLLEKVATIMYAYHCDIVLLSGRPTSLKPIKDIFLKYFSVSPNRLIVLNKFRIGRWYPYTLADENGYLTNSKSVVPVGAMIGHLASTAGGYNDFSLDLSELGSKLKPTTDCFIIKDHKALSNECFITKTKNSGEVILKSFPSYIGSKQFDLSLYPVRPFFVLDINEDSIKQRLVAQYAEKGQILNSSELQYIYKQYKEDLLQKSPLTFTFEREDYEENREQLTIASVTGSDGEDLRSSDFILIIQSLNDTECYWLDSGEFNININSNL